MKTKGEKKSWFTCRNEGANDGEINFPNKWITRSKLDGEMGVMCIHGKRGLQL
jgi:hypothetical protein